MLPYTLVYKQIIFGIKAKGLQYYCKKGGPGPGNHDYGSRFRDVGYKNLDYGSDYQDEGTKGFKELPNLPHIVL